MMTTSRISSKSPLLSIRHPACSWSIVSCCSNPTKDDKPMNPSIRTLSCVAIGFLLVCVSSTRAQETTQEKTPKFELGIHYSALNVSEDSDTDSGLGFRFTYNLNKYLGVEAETTDFQRICEDCVSNERQALFGVRAGKRSGRYGLFAKVRPGYTRFYLL